jgi:hypothetical protein
MDKINSTINFIYFTANHPHDFVSKVWKGHWLKEHLQSKFNQSIDFLSFVFELDYENKVRLLKWIDENYDCGMTKKIHD